MAMVSIIAKGCIVARVLPLRCFLFLLPNYINILMFVIYLHYIDEPEVFFLNMPKQQYFMLLTSGE